MRVAYLGPPGSFTEEAALSHFGEDCELVPCPDVPEVFEAVERRQAGAGVVPIENSIEGSVNVTLDVLIHGAGVLVVGEEVLAVRQMLAALPGTALTDVTRVVTHPQALAQCRGWLDLHLPGAERVPALSTSAAAAVAAERRGTAAIGTARAARINRLEVLASDVQDHAGNQTRFAVLGCEPAAPTGQDRTSICCSTAEDRPGSLLEILREFSQRNINLTKIESRPVKGELGRYYFLVDLEGHRDDVVVAGALAAVEALTYTYACFGSYPRALAPG
ncbi:MAG: prephenate dehydratase [Candidatus Dormibacteria bacterium]